MIEGKLVITFEAYNVKHRVEMGDEASIEDIFNVINSMLIGLTYPQKVIENTILEWAETITGTDHDRTTNTDEED
jgi:hypothetical protein